MEINTIPDLFENSVEKFRENVFLWEKQESHYKGLTYEESKKRVYNYTAGFLKKGLKKDQRVALIAEGRNDWVLSELAILYFGGVCVPLSVKIEEEQDLIFRLRHSGCKAIVISGNHQHKALHLAEQLHELELIVLLDGKNSNNFTDKTDWDRVKFPDNKIIDIEELINEGAAHLKKNENLIFDLLNELKGDDNANICYTSGTTADPKGIILTHKNYLCNIQQSSSMFEVPEYYTSLHILPWDHAFAHTVGIYTLMGNGASMASLKLGKTLNETIRNIPVSIKEVRPYFLLSVPALAKNFKNNIEKGITEKGKLVSWLFRTGLKTGIIYNQKGFNKGEGLRILLKPLYALFNAILFKKIQENFGGRLKFFVGGGALLDIELQKFFYTIGLPMYQGYGLTEAAPVISSNTPEHHKLGSSGRVVPDLELRICNEQGNELPIGHQGEIVVRGKNVMKGYWMNEKATKETIRDGWLYTGDLGYLDQDGYLYVLGRNKSLLIGSDGEKYSPEGIEETMTAKSKFIDNIMLYNNQSPYTVAVLVPNKSQLKAWADKNHFDTKSEEGHKAVLLKIKSETDRFLPGGDMENMFPPRWIPSATIIASEPFSEQNRMINSTMKMVRPLITKHYEESIDFLLTTEGKDICHEKNMRTIAKWFETPESKEYKDK